MKLSIDQSDLMEAAQRLVRAARAAGADAADVVATTGVSLSADVRDGEVEIRNFELGVCVTPERRRAPACWMLAARWAFLLPVAVEVLGALAGSPLRDEFRVLQNARG